MIDLLLVWSPATAGAAIAGGLGLGYFVFGMIAEHPTYASSATARQIGSLVVMCGILAGTVFYAGQAVATDAEGDSLWPRVVSRYGIWCLYAVALAVGTYVRIRRGHSKRHAKAVAQAHQELGR